MTKEILEKSGYDYQYGKDKWTEKDIETMKKWHHWGKFIGQFYIDGFWYKVFDR